MTGQAITWRPCETCQGTGEARGIVEDATYTCGGCGGHKRQPAADSIGVAWFYRPPRPGYGTRWDRPVIAALQRDPDDPARWRVTKWDQRGPASHWIEKADHIMHELQGFHEAPRAAWLLDQWSGRPAWRDGCDRLAFVAYLSTFSYRDRLDLARQVNAAASEHGIAAALRLAETLRRQYLPGEALYG